MYATCQIFRIFFVPHSSDIYGSLIHRLTCKPTKVASIILVIRIPSKSFGKFHPVYQKFNLMTKQLGTGYENTFISLLCIP